jgi:membrane protein
MDTDRPGTGWWPTLKRTATEFQEDNLSDWAPALTYYGLLSLFPALVAMVSLIGIFGDPRSTTESLTEIIDPPKDQATT